MSIASAKGTSAEQAVEIAHRYFGQFFAGQNVGNVLLEELEFDEKTRWWRVVIGFDVGRKKLRQPSINALTLPFPYDTEEIPVREARAFFIADNDKALISVRAA
jgi:hypothetical protein